MRLVTYNIQWGLGRDRRIDLDRIARIVAGADIVVLQEVERHWRPQQWPDQAVRLASLMPSMSWVFGATIDLCATDPQAPRRRFGNMVLSRWPIVSTRTLPLQSEPVPGEFNDQSSTLEAVIAGPEFALRVYGVHLTHLPGPPRLRQVERLLAFVDEAGRLGTSITAPGRDTLGPDDEWLVLPDGIPPSPSTAILAGDFNSTPGTPEYDRLTEAFTDALAGSAITTYPSLSGARIDHVLLSPELGPRLRRGWIDEAADGSDHQPVWVEIAT